MLLRDPATVRKCQSLAYSSVTTIQSWDESRELLEIRSSKEMLTMWLFLPSWILFQCFKHVQLCLHFAGPGEHDGKFPCNVHLNEAKILFVHNSINNRFTIDLSGAY